MSPVLSIVLPKALTPLLIACARYSSYGNTGAAPPHLLAAAPKLKPSAKCATPPLGSCLRVVLSLPVIFEYNV